MPVAGSKREWKCIDKMVRHHCVIMRGGKILSYGHNKPSPFAWHGQCYMRHAECDAILNLPKKYLRSHGKRYRLRIVVYRTDMGESKPCDQCIRFMHSVCQHSDCRFNTVIYSRDSQSHRERFHDLHNDHQSTYWKAASATGHIVK